jgi:Mrp family chromosome partitioning ATPase
MSTILVCCNEDNPSGSGRVIGLTSVTPGAGCSTLSINLAGLAAVRGDKVLLVDCQFRNPTLTRKLMPKSKAGIEQVARGLCSLADAVWTDPRNGLDALPAGDAGLVRQGVPPSPDMLVSVLREARGRYTTIVLDLSLPETAREARALAPLADVVYVVIDQGRAPTAALRQALQNCLRGGMSLCGFILNKATI